MNISFYFFALNKLININAVRGLPDGSHWNHEIPSDLQVGYFMKKIVVTNREFMTWPNESLAGHVRENCACRIEAADLHNQSRIERPSV